MWWIYFASIYENRRMKLVEIVLRGRGWWGRGITIQGVNPTKIF
jgi:hypothetical protein